MAPPARPDPPALSAVQRYLAVLRAPDVARLMAAAVVARMPIGIDTLAILLFVGERKGSFAAAGATAAAFGVGIGVVNPLQGRAIDRYGQRRVLLPLSLGHVAGLLALVAFGLGGAPVGVLIVCGLVSGASLPPVGAAVRPLLPRLLAGRPDLLPTAYAVDSIAIELTFVAGPLLTALVVTVASPAGALVVACGFALVGTLALVSTAASRTWTGARGGQRRLLGALASPGVRTLIATTVPLGFCFGATEVTIAAFADDAGKRTLAGVLLAVWSLGSLLGGLAYGARVGAGPVAPRYIRLAAVLPLLYLPLAAAPSVAVMLVLCLVAGAGISPVLASANQLVGDVAPAGSVTEAYTWPVTALVVGIAAGNAAAGGLVEVADWRVSFLAAAAAAALGAALAVTRRLTLAPV